MVVKGRELMVVKGRELMVVKGRELMTGKSDLKTWHSNDNHDTANKGRFYFYVYGLTFMFMV